MPKSRLTLSAVYATGIALCQEQEFICDTRLLAAPATMYKVLELRIAIPSRQAEEVHEAFVRGEVEVLIQDVPSRVSR